MHKHHRCRGGFREFDTTARADALCPAAGDLPVGAAAMQIRAVSFDAWGIAPRNFVRIECNPYF